MKRLVALIALITSLGVALKLGGKRLLTGAPAARPGEMADRTPEPETPAPTDRDRLLGEYPERADLVARVVDRFGPMAATIERTDGLRGLELLDRLDLEAVFLYEHHPEDFRELAGLIGDEAAAEILLGWGEYFGLKRSDAVDRSLLIAQIERLGRRERAAAARFPSALPLILADPRGVTDLIERWDDDPGRLGDALAVLMCIDLGDPSGDFPRAVRTLDRHGDVAIEAFRLQGLDGFAGVHRFGPVFLSLRGAVPVEESLILLRVNAEFVDEMLRGGGAEEVARLLRHVAAVGLVDEVGNSPHGLRLVRDYGRLGEVALREGGASAGSIVYELYAEASIRDRAVDALAEHGPAARAMLAKYADDPDFRAILREYGPDVIPPVASADAAPEMLAQLKQKEQRTTLENVALALATLSADSGQKAIRLIRDDGLERVRELNSSETAYYEFLPLYDVIHLGNVLRKGQSPTRGEMSWALIDACFVIADAVSLVALQPEGVAASELARSELKVAARETAERIGRRVADDAAEAAQRAVGRRGAALATGSAADHAARWMVVRAAGGVYRSLKHYPEALARLSVSRATEMARPFAAKAGLSLSRWAPMRFVRDGAVVLRRIPPERGLKYLALEATQAGVGVAAIHKMEEHLASRRPAPTPPPSAG